MWGMSTAFGLLHPQNVDDLEHSKLVRHNQMLAGYNFYYENSVQLAMQKCTTRKALDGQSSHFEIKQL